MSSLMPFSSAYSEVWYVQGEKGINELITDASFLSIIDLSGSSVAPIQRIELSFASALTSAGGEVLLDWGKYQAADIYPGPCQLICAEIVSGSVVASVVPIPAAVWLFGSALAGLGWLRRR